MHKLVLPRVIQSLFWLVMLLLLAWSVPLAHADEAPTATLLPGARADYRFDYKGDKSRIEIALDAGGVPGVDLFVYTPAAIQEAGRGGDLEAIGRGTPNNGHDAFWAGGFPAPGVYQVAVVNTSPGVILYRLSITGDAVGNVAPMLAAPPASEPASISAARLTVPLPPGAGSSAAQISVPSAPATCTHAYETPPILTFSIRLCPNEIYAPIHVVGWGIGVFGDAGGSAVVTSGGRQFAITIDGDRNLVDGVVIQASAESADLGAWLCQYEECVFATQPVKTTIHGGIVYGGGILLRGSYSAIKGVTVHGGTIGVATVNGSGNIIVDNRLDDLNGWGIFSIASTNSYFVGNSVNRENHACTTPDGFKFLHGCETAGWVCLGCHGNVVARNHCEASGNCFYMSGERNLASTNNRLIANYCAGATDNCFELTFSRGNVLQDNITTADPRSGAACKYPFWIGGSTVYFKGNRWQCSISPEKAIQDAIASTREPTQVIEDVLPILAPAATSAAGRGEPPARPYLPAPLPAWKQKLLEE